MGDAHMVGFGFKQAWLAIRVSAAGAPSTRQILAALDAQDLGQVGWQQGIDLAYLTDDRIAITPPLPGVDDSTWVLVAGRAFFADNAAVDVAALSTRLDTEVQFFATHRVVEAHVWERAAEGALIRSFRYVGETGEVTHWYGGPDAAEVAIGLPVAYALDAEPDDQVSVLVDEDDVLAVAAAWSLDPSQLDGQPAPGPLRVAMLPAGAGSATSE